MFPVRFLLFYLLSMIS